MQLDEIFFFFKEKPDLILQIIKKLMIINQRAKVQVLIIKNLEENNIC